ncbi:hypothetical protein JCM10599A_62800 [Paraburkholderia kururiensis]
MVGACTGGEVSERLAVRMGLSAQMVGHVLACAADVVVAALAATAAEGRGAATRVFGTLVSRECDAHIGSRCAQRVSTTGGLRALGEEGDALLVRATGRHVASLSDHVAARCGIPAQAAHMLACVAAAIVGGLMKHHLLLEQGDAAQLPGLLASQMPLVEVSTGDGVAAELGYDTAAAFMATVPVRLAAVAADFPGPREEAGRGAAMAVQGAQAPVEPAAPAAGAGTLRPVHADYAAAMRYAGLPVPRGQTVAPQGAAADSGDAPAARRRSATPWLLVLVGACVLAGLFAWAKLGGQADAGAGRAATARPGEVRPERAGAVAGAVAPGAARATPSGAAGSASSAAASAPASSASGAAAPGPAGASAAAAVPGAAVADGGWLDGRTNAAGVPALEAMVGDAAQRATLEEAVNARFGAGHLAVTVAPDRASGPLPWLDHPDALLAVLAEPGAELTVRGNQVWLGGLAAPQAQGWSARLQQALGPAFAVGVFDAAVEQAQATDAFLRAMAALLQTDSPCAVPGAVAVLNLQRIDFVSSSGHVPATAQQDLSESAQLLRACAARGQALHLSVDAWTDRRGDLPANLALSHKRAGAVRAFLIDAGVPAQTLSAHGHGATDPVAGNLTAAGRFANRRIRFMPAGS